MYKVLNIASSTEFLRILAHEITRSYGTDPIAFSRVLILLPNRRSCRLLQDMFLENSQDHTTILPRIRPIGDVEEEELLFSDISGEEWDIPVPVGVYEQRVLLTKLIQKWQHGKAEWVTIDKASELAAELIRFLNEVEREKVAWNNLYNLVPADYAEHWQTTLSFLEIIARNWPDILADMGKISPLQYRNQLLERLVNNWEKNPPAFPIIAAGSTGSIPATRKLLKTVAGLPLGQVVLPGLDTHMDEESWQQIEAGHPQHNLKQLLAYIGVSRQQVETLGGVAKRGWFISELMRPTKTTHLWRNCDQQRLQESVEGISLVEHATEAEEAATIALIMRESLETPGKKTILVTHDRTLANRVKQRLKQWNIMLDDSAGEPLMLTSPAVFFMLFAEMADTKLSPASLLALLRHPLFTVGGAAQSREYARVLEMNALRGMPPRDGFSGIFSRLKKKGADEVLVVWLRQIEKYCQPFLELMLQDKVNFGILLKAHIEAVELLAETLWESEEGRAWADCLGEILHAADTVGEIETWSYTKFLRGLLETKMYRPSYGNHPRLAMLSPQEARLLDADCVILGGLNEGSWPPSPASDPWMSIPMRKQFGLPPREKKIGMAAHDFCQLLDGAEVILTRANKSGGKPNIPSRWLLRMDALLQGKKLHSNKPWQQWAAMLSEPSAYSSEIVPPAPVPPIESRPTNLYVTQVEKLMRDPYSIYASHILKLKALDPLDEDITHADFGNVIHEILAKFIRSYNTIEEGQHLEYLLALGQAELARYMEESPSAEVFWWSRFERIAAWFVEKEAQKRTGGLKVFAECQGMVTLDVGGKPFQLQARADRLETDKTGAINMVDYKTGSIPGKGDIKLGFSNQMTLEGLIAEMGGFEVDGHVAQLEYWKLTGGGPAVSIEDINEVAQHISEAKEGIQRLLEYYLRPDTAYPSEPWAKHAPRFSDYRHLARVKEWQGSAGEE